ncbi:c-type cytochrome biogenesis protein CcsB, partial [Streptomyces sp. NPDC059956]
MQLAAAANESLAHLSNNLIYASMAVYTLAFFAHIAEWIFGSRSKVARTAAALTQAGAASGSGAAAPAVQVRGKAGTAVLDTPKVVTRSAAGTRDVPDGPGAAGGTVQG